MLKEDLNHLLRSESETVEWKRSLGEWKEIVIAAAAMASLHGGQICIGVEPTGKVCGVRRGGGRSYWYELRDSGGVPQNVPQDQEGNAT